MTGAYDDELQVDGAVSRISPVVDPTTGTVKVTVDVAADQTVIRPGSTSRFASRSTGIPTYSPFPDELSVWDDGEPVAWKVIEAKPPGPSEDDGRGQRGRRRESGGFLAELFGGDEAAEEGEEDDTDPWRASHAAASKRYVWRLDSPTPSASRSWMGSVTASKWCRSATGLRAETLVKLPGDPDPPKDDDKDGENDKEGGHRADRRSEG